MNGGKIGATKKSNAHLNVGTNGTISNAHGYGPIGGNVLNMKPSNNNVPQGYSHLNIQGFKNQNGNSSSNAKEGLPFSKINGKLKKKAITNNLANLQLSCNANPKRD
jgi:hypothetical protein